MRLTTERKVVRGHASKWAEFKTPDAIVSVTFPCLFSSVILSFRFTAVVFDLVYLISKQKKNNEYVKRERHVATGLEKKAWSWLGKVGAESRTSPWRICAGCRMVRDATR